MNESFSGKNKSFQPTNAILLINRHDSIELKKRISVTILWVKRQIAGCFTTELSHHPPLSKHSFFLKERNEIG